MAILNSVWTDRVQHWLRTLKADFYRPLGRIELEAFRTMEHLPYEEAQQRKYTPVKTGFTWGNTWEYCWFRGKFELPENAEGKRIVLNLNPGGESTLFVNGEEFGTYRADWIAQPHHYMVDNTITRDALPGSRYEICMETYAGHYFPNCETGYCATGPVLPGSYQDPLAEGSRRILGECTYGIWCEDAYQLYMDVETLYRLLEAVDENSLRAAKIAQALKQFTLDVDFEQPQEEREACYRNAREGLKEAMRAQNGSSAPVFWAVGNAHLDLAWLWPVAETERKTARTFAAQLRLMEEYPEYRFIQSQPAEYELCRKYYPKLFERVLEKIRQGQWIADGAMWVEPDTNMAGGEALIRQLLYGKQYYKEVLGVDSRVLWLPDTFGYTAALPQILKGCDVPYLVTQKIFWCCNDGERFPYHYFYWEGMDGSRVTSFLPTSYTYQTDPKETTEVWNQREQKEDLEAFLLPFGYGDGGGGPSRDHVEYVLRQKDLEGSPKMKMGSPEEFFRMMEAEGGPKHTYTGELYFASHRGTYTSQAQAKKNNRRNEFALRDMELWSALAGIRGLPAEQETRLELWKKFLFLQFHDILPGSSIERVYKEAQEQQEEIRTGAERMTEKAMRVLAGSREEKMNPSGEGEAVAVWNSLSFERTGLVTLPEDFRKGAVSSSGDRIPVFIQREGLKAAVTVPPCGWITLYPAEEQIEEEGMPATVLEEEHDGYRMENAYVSARIDRKGQMVSCILKSSGRQMAAAPMNRLRLFRDIPRHFDAWDIDEDYQEQELEGAFDQRTEVVSRGLEAVLKVEGKIGGSSYVQYIRLEAEGKRIDFETHIEWKELHRLLKVSFPVQVHAVNARNEIQFGYVGRPTHRSRTYDRDRFEVCNHRYTALCDNSHGAAVLNDCKYGISVEGNEMALTLLRAAASPQMRADNGSHVFTYSFYAWEGGFADCDVIRQGYELNSGLKLTRGSAGSCSLLDIGRKNIILETVKPAEDGSGDLILRFYEAAGAAVETDICFHAEIEKLWKCNMLEEKGKELKQKEGRIRLNFGMFEIKTIRMHIKSFFCR